MTPDELLHRIRERVTHPSTVKELMRALKLPRSDAPGIRRALKTLVDRGALIETRGRHFGVPELMDLAPGRITVHPNGFGFVRLDQPIDEVAGDVYVAGHNLHDAMHGDRVLVRSRIDALPLHIAKPTGDLNYFRTAKRALRAIHRDLLTHNDLAKEQNWLRTPDGRAMLTDFQLATKF